VPALSISEQACAEEACAEPFKYFNPNLHTSEDKAEGLDFDYAANIIDQSFWIEKASHLQIELRTYAQTRAPVAS